MGQAAAQVFPWEAQWSAQDGFPVPCRPKSTTPKHLPPLHSPSRGSWQVQRSVQLPPPPLEDAAAVAEEEDGVPAALDAPADEEDVARDEDVPPADEEALEVDGDAAQSHTPDSPQAKAPHSRGVHTPVCHRRRWGR